MKITKTELEFDEIYKGRVKPIATGGHIPFFKKFIGRIVHIILPRKQKGFWLLSEKDLKILQKESEKIKFPEPYSKQRKNELTDSLSEIIKHLPEFELDNLITVIGIFEKQENLNKETKNLIKRIKELYSI